MDGWVGSQGWVESVGVQARRREGKKRKSRPVERVAEEAKRADEMHEETARQHVRRHDEQSNAILREERE